MLFRPAYPPRQDRIQKSDRSSISVPAFMSSSLGSLVARARHPTYSRQAVSSVVRISSEGDPLTHMERDISILTSSSHPVRPHGRDSSQRREERQETRADSYELFLFELLDPTEGICSEPSAIERIALLDFEYLSSAHRSCPIKDCLWPLLAHSSLGESPLLLSYGRKRSELPGCGFLSSEMERALITRQESKPAVGQRRVDPRVKGSPSQSVHQSVAGAWLRAGLCLLLLIDSNELAIELVFLFFFLVLEADSGRRRSATRWEISEEVGIGKCSIGTWEQLKAELKAQFLPVSDRLVDFKYLGARSRTGGKGPRQARGPERCRNVEEEGRGQLLNTIKGTMSESSRGGACFTPLHRGHGKRTRQSGLSRHGGIAQVSDSVASLTPGFVRRGDGLGRAQSSSLALDLPCTESPAEMKGGIASPIQSFVSRDLSDSGGVESLLCFPVRSVAL
ncbi:hypothetical protein V6N12_075903 [Hibiscus sabdariffa]|uniref:Uncharacterized protein n=1 Tax=Hibiscus sabdariffa TaxID=183260 RepID=A0ABR2AY86_9ROSI